MELKDVTDEAVRDEIKGRDGYRSLAMRLDNEGHHSESRIVSGMADDEDRHANLLMTMMRTIKEEPEELKLGERMIEVPLGRLFPKTYGDWVKLGMDIKEKAGIDDFETTKLVNMALNAIYEEDPSAGDKKRWLTEKASELGIT